MTKELIRAMMKAGRDPYDELRRVMRERDDARAILSDLLTERGESWLAQLVGRREEASTAPMGCAVTSAVSSTMGVGVSLFAGQSTRAPPCRTLATCPRTTRSY